MFNIVAGIFKDGVVCEAIIIRRLRLLHLYIKLLTIIWFIMLYRVKIISYLIIDIGSSCEQNNIIRE